MAGSEQRINGGALNAALANELGKLIADFTGRGRDQIARLCSPGSRRMRVRGWRNQAQQNLVAAGNSELVHLQRAALQRAMGPRLIAAVERLTRPKVRLFLSGTDEHGGSAIEAFLLEGEPAMSGDEPSN